MTKAAAALSSIEKGQLAYCKFLSANDTKATKAHQSGYLIGIHSWPLLFPQNREKDPDAERRVHMIWNEDAWDGEARFKYYSSKNELRLTRMGRGFPFTEAEYTGALFVLVRRDYEEYEAFVLNDDEEIDEVLDTLGIGPMETNSLLDAASMAPEYRLQVAMRAFAGSGGGGFPSAADMSAAARSIWFDVFDHEERIRQDPDLQFVKWADTEYALFREFENILYAPMLGQGFASVDSFVAKANEIINRRKSRAGKGLENHLAAIFDGNDVKYTAQAVTEGKKKPDFIFPSQEAYRDTSFPKSGLTFLASKRTCKDRWRQILNEADRLRDEPKYLFTLQAGNSPAQLEEMKKEKVVLVVPRDTIQAYPAEYRQDIWTLKQFVDLVAEKQRSYG